MADNKYVFPTSKTAHTRFPTHTNDPIMDRSEAATPEAFQDHRSHVLMGHAVPEEAQSLPATLAIAQACAPSRDLGKKCLC